MSMPLWDLWSFRKELTLANSGFRLNMAVKAFSVVVGLTHLGAPTLVLMQAKNVFQSNLQ